MGIRLPTFYVAGTFANKWLYQLPLIVCIKIQKKRGRLPVLNATQCWQTYRFGETVFAHEF